MGFFVGATIFFITMIIVIAFTIFLYISLVMAVKNNSNVPIWMYKIGHAIRGRGEDIYEDFIDKSAFYTVNFYIIGVVLLSVIAYFAFYGRYFPNDKIAFWIRAEFFIIISMRLVIILGKIILNFILYATGKSTYNINFSAMENAVIGMFLMSMFICVLTLNITGLPVKAPVVQVGEYEIVIGHTSAEDLLSKGFTFIGKNLNDSIVNKRDSHFYFGETVELVKGGKGYGYVNLTPRYKDKAKLEDCIVTYYGISSKSKMFSCVKIENRNISELSVHNFEKENIRDIFSLSPVTYEESKGNDIFSLRMQTYPYMLWKRYTIEVTFFRDDKSNQFEVYAQHTLWE